MAGWPADCVDLIVTSPPYNLLAAANSGGFSPSSVKHSKWKASEFHFGGYDDHVDQMPHKEYVAWQRSCLDEMLRLLRPGGAIFYNHKWRVLNGLLQDRSDIVEGFPVRQIIVWQRKGGINFNPGYFLPTYEVIYLIVTPEFRLAPKKNAVGDVWKIDQESNNPHPAPMPLALAQRLIDSTTASVILDPFLGSGTTAVAAMRAGRQWVGIEQSERYCEMAHDRIVQERRQPSLL